MKRQTYVCGLDVHKDNVYAAMYNGIDRSEVKVFGTFTDPISELIQWLEQNRVKRIAMESTGIYWVPVWNMLEERDLSLHWLIRGSLSRCLVAKVM
jgi:transposase